MLTNLLLATVSSVALYKNGQVLVTREVTPENGVALVEAKDSPAHGTFWHSANQPLEISAVELDESEIVFFADPSFGDLLARAQNESGLSVTHFDRDPGKGVLYTLKGKLLNVQDDRSYQQNFRMELDSGSTVIIPKHRVIASRSAKNYWKFVGADKPFSIQYLTTGATWAPSYRFVLKGKDSGLLAMTCDIRNEQDDWENVEVSVISGVPSLAFAYAKSFMSPKLTLRQFLDGLNGEEDSRPRSRKSVMSQSMSNFAADDECEDIDIAAYASSTSLAGAGADVHVRGLGKLTLKKGTTVEKPLGAAETKCRRLVEWKVAENEKLWDAIELVNPFAFPLTTAPIEVVKDGRLLGQAQISWTNPGDTTLVKITPALSVKGSFFTEEDPGKHSKKADHSSSDSDGDTRRFRGVSYRKANFKTTVVLENFRQEEVTVRFTRRFEGERVACDVEPAKLSVLPRNNESLNVSTELTWVLTLKPLEKRTVEFEGKRWVRW